MLKLSTHFGSLRWVSSNHLQDDDTELSDLFFALQAIEMLPGNRSFEEAQMSDNRASCFSFASSAAKFTTHLA